MNPQLRPPKLNHAYASYAAHIFINIFTLCIYTFTRYFSLGIDNRF